MPVEPSEYSIKRAAFSTSVGPGQAYPERRACEIAVVGKSNVGKSSLINRLCGNSKLARTSATPGKTRLINFFDLTWSDASVFSLVDLPGYGYAKRSKTIQQKIDNMINSYLLMRKQLANVFVLIDIRHAPQKIDLEFINWLGTSSIPFSLVFTKADKLSNQKAHDNVKNYMDALSETWEELPPYFVTSSEKKTGRDEILSYIESINKDIATP